MKITILTIGNRGDVQPFVALSLGLKQVGHEIKIVTHSVNNFREKHLIFKNSLEPVFGIRSARN